ncbi:MAG: hypothetical protein NVS2B16_36340 [Chloroflexota bacterium]
MIATKTRNPHQHHGDVMELTPLEYCVLGLMTEHRTGEIADILNYTTSYIANIETIIHKKLGVHSRLQAVLELIRREPGRLVSPSESRP